VMIFYGVGELLQNMAVARSKNNITKLMDIRPDFANLKTANGIKIVSPEEIQTGDIILVRAGEKIPLDGIVVSGQAFVDTMALTGEAVPRRTSIGDDVYSGTLSTDGLLEIKVTKLFYESTVSKVLELVQNASSKKAESEKFITKFARYYTPIVVFTAIAVAVVPPLFGLGAFSVWLYRALCFLIISCPCALVVSIPISFFGGIGGAAKQGILVKGGNYLEALNNVDTIVFDKTGTLTQGVFKVTEIAPINGVSEEHLLNLAATAEFHSTHPIAKSILSACTTEIHPALSITEKAGFGIIATTQDAVIYAGNAKLMADIGIINLPSFTKTAVYIAMNKKYMGYILISDEMKSSTAQALLQLKALGVKTLVMFTGDSQSIAKDVASKLCLDDYHAGLLPQDKVSQLEKLMTGNRKNKTTVFVGDGINDAPVLTRADIGIAMGGIGSDAAIEAADIVIMNDDISKIATAIKVAAKTRHIVTQNIIFALGVKLIIMLLSFFGITSMWFAIFADVGVALIALLNALRAMKI
ncbi:MAG: heavy metal translocating P-type ATPase, partial [Oscillospiraceae bacterium]